LNVLRISRFSAVILALTVSFAACTDSTGVNDEPFDADASAADLEVVQSAFTASVFESLAISSQTFGLVADTTPLPVSLLQASVAAATAGSHWEGAAVAQAFAAGPASGPLLPDVYLGRTYVRDVDGYRWDETRSDAPADGVRFVLYEVDPITGTPGTTEIGYVDLTDESTTLAYVARVKVVTNSVVRIDYSVSAVVGVGVLTLTVDGFIDDGTNRVEVNLSMAYVNDPPVERVTVVHSFSVPSRGFEVDATVVFEFNNETLAGSIDINAAFSEGDHSVTFTGVIEIDEGDFPSESGTFEIHVDGLLFATIVVGNDTVTVQNGTGHELTAAEIQAVRSIFDGLQEMFDERFEDFLRPVAWMFDR
jgi:hypothetical protein